MSAPRPYVTDPFHPLGSICGNESVLYICQRFPVTSSKWYIKVYHGTVGNQKLRMCFSKTMSLRLKRINQITWQCRSKGNTSGGGGGTQVLEA